MWPIEKYPAGLLHLTYAQTHLASLDDRRTTCFRCERAGATPDE